MGWMTKPVQGYAVEAAAKRAADEGRTVFTPRLVTPSLTGLSGSVASWAETIEAIEALGWRLEQWSVATDRRGGVQAFPVFRR